MDAAAAGARGGVVLARSFGSRAEGAETMGRRRGAAAEAHLRAFQAEFPGVDRKALAEAQSRVFGNFINETGQRSGRKVVLRKLKYDNMWDDVTHDVLKFRSHKMDVDPNDVVNEEMREVRARRGKVKPKKGQGKRAQMGSKKR